MHASLLRFLGGVPKFVVCDNLKAAVTNPDRYDPGINRTYAEMAGHYGTAILAARSRRPKDKAKVEVAVQIDITTLTGCLSQSAAARINRASEWTALYPGVPILVRDAETKLTRVSPGAIEFLPA